MAKPQKFKLVSVTCSRQKHHIFVCVQYTVGTDMTMSISEESSSAAANPPAAAAAGSNNNNVKDPDSILDGPEGHLMGGMLYGGPAPPAGARPIPGAPHPPHPPPKGSWVPPGPPPHPGAPPPAMGWDPHQPPPIMEPTYAPLVKVRAQRAALA